MQQQVKDFINGKVEKKVFNNGGSILKVSIPEDEIKRILNNGWVNIDIKVSKKTGKPYMEKNVWQPKKTEGGGK